MALCCNPWRKQNESGMIQCICKNVAVNNILSAYVHKASQYGIAVSLHVNVGENIGVNDFDLVSILANIMENAIHSCMRSKKTKPFIDVDIRKKSSKLVIYIENTTDGEILFEDGIPKSRYSEGMGMSSIVHSTAKYGGEYDFRAQNDIFICQILLQLPYMDDI